MSHGKEGKTFRQIIQISMEECECAFPCWRILSPPLESRPLILSPILQPKQSMQGLLCSSPHRFTTTTIAVARTVLTKHLPTHTMHPVPTQKDLSVVAQCCCSFEERPKNT